MTFGKTAYEWLCQSIGISDCEFDVVKMQGSTSSSVFLIGDSHALNPHMIPPEVLQQRTDAYLKSVVKHV